jgi:hypothetical protein
METASGGFDMWYGSTVAWDGGNGEMVHVIKHAFSRDGNIWHKDGEAIPWELGKAQAFSRPTVIREANGPLHMWFSYRSGTGASYRIGYATSPDARRWTLENENSGLSLSDNGWDSTMVEYPFVFAHGSETYMLYNGNGFGKSGFGLAVLETEL